MGGTTAKCGLIEDMKADQSDQMEIDRGPDANRFLPGSGYLLRVPTIELIEIGSGGGSIASIDRAGVLQVGPRSAGADPGPVCYDTGGTEITQTDANVILGYFNPAYLVGGDLKLNTPRAVETLTREIAEPLGLSVIDAAYGIYSLANAKMSRMVKAVTTERGRNPMEYTLVAFGGCGPAHAVAIAEELGIRRVMIPPWAGLFSSVGLHLADVEQYRTWTYWRNLDELEFDKINGWFQQTEAETMDLMLQQGISKADVSVLRFADMRYAGQGSELTIPLATKILDSRAATQLRQRFNVEHERHYGYRTEEPVEIFRLQLVTRSSGKGPAIPPYREAGVQTPVVARPAYFGPEQGWLETRVLRRREDFLNGHIAGPAILEEYDATTVVRPGWLARVDEWGNMLIDRK
jgi:N-methylhydantoinase A